MADNQVKVIVAAEDHATGVFAKVGDGLDGLIEKLGGLSGLLEGVAIEELARRFVEFAAATLEEETALAKLSEKTGIAISDLAGLSLAAKVAGVDEQGLETSLKKLAQTLSDGATGNVKAQATLQSLGISARDSSGQVISLSDAIAKIADKFANSKDGADKAAIAIAAFGKQGLQMIPILNEGAKGIAEMEARAEEFHLKLSEADKDGLLQFEKDLALVKAAGQGLTQEFVNGLLPALDEIAKAMLDNAGGFDAARLSGEALGGILKVLATVLLTIGSTFAWAGEQALHFFGIIKDAGEDLDTRLKKIWGDIWDPAPAQAGSKKGTEAIERAAADAEKIRKQELANNVAYWEEATAVTKAQNAAQLQNLEATYRQGLISVQEYFDKKKALQLDSLNAEFIATQAELELYDKAAASKNLTDVERLQLQEKINASTAKEAEIVAQIAAVNGKNAKTGNDDPLAQKAQQLEIYAAEAQKLGQQIDDVFARLDADTQAVTTAESNYQITVLQGEAKINALRDAARQKVQGMVGDYHSLAAASGDPKLIANADKFEKKIDELAIHFSALRKEAIQGGTQDLENFFAGEIDGSARGADAFKKFGQALLTTLAQIEAKMLAVWLIQKALGWIGGAFGGGGSVEADAGSLTPGGIDFGDGISAAAGGGSFNRGDWSWVGEAGPELVHFGSDATVIPSGASMDMAGGGGGDTYIDARGAQAGVSQEVLNAIRIHSQAAAQQAKIDIIEMQRRRA